MVENGPFSFFSVLTLGVNQCLLINNWVPHQCSVFCFQRLLNCSSTDALRAAAQGLSPHLIHSPWMHDNTSDVSILCVFVSGRGLCSGFLWSLPAAFSRKIFHPIFSTNRRGELKKSRFQRWEHRFHTWQWRNHLQPLKLNVISMLVKKAD